MSTKIFSDNKYYVNIKSPQQVLTCGLWLNTLEVAGSNPLSRLYAYIKLSKKILVAIIFTYISLVNRWDEPLCQNTIMGEFLCFQEILLYFHDAEVRLLFNTLEVTGSNSFPKLCVYIIWKDWGFIFFPTCFAGVQLLACEMEILTFMFYFRVTD